MLINKNLFLHKQIVHNEKVSLAYSKIGTGDNTVLCIHGITRNGKDFDYLATALAKQYTVICVDIFGRGHSDLLQNKKKYNYNTYYHSIINLIKELNISKVSLVGTSMGGIIAMYIAAYNHELIEKMVLNDIGASINLKALQKLVTHIKKFPTFASKAEAENYLTVLLSPLALKEKDHLSHMIESSITINDDGNYYLNYDPAIGKIFDENIKSMEGDMDLWHIWKQINCPVLILRGQVSNILMRTTAQKMMIGRDNVKLIEYPGVGHVPSLMEDNQILDIVKWLTIES